LTRNRILRIALLPILAPIFLVGWVVAHLGEQELASRKARRTRVSAAKIESPMEMGLLAERKEDEIVVS
jgi:hypothetical protein